MWLPMLHLFKVKYKSFIPIKSYYIGTFDMSTNNEINYNLQPVNEWNSVLVPMDKTEQETPFVALLKNTAL